jgi:hypothetical protein
LTNTPTPPSGSIAPSTQPPRCDLSCGPCGWRGTDNVCRDGYPPNQPPGGLICCISGTAVPPSATPTTRPGQPTNTLAPGQPTYTLAPGQPTYTPTPSGPTSTPTPYPLVNGFRCDQRCGICGGAIVLTSTPSSPGRSVTSTQTPLVSGSPSKPPISGDARWTLLLLIPISLIIGALVL